MAILGRLSWIKLIIYMVAQYLGAFTGAACVYGIYIDGLNNFDNGTRHTGGVYDTAGIFATYPASHVSILQGFFDQVFGTMLLTLCIMAIVDKNNMKTSHGVIPLCVGGVVTVIGLSFGFNCGYAVNPARDMGPRLFTAIAGWGTDVFTVSSYWFWVPWIAPHIGAVLGGWLYLLLVGIHLEADVHRGEISRDHKDSEMRDISEGD
jgi:MIP family channel proteins